MNNSLTITIGARLVNRTFDKLCHVEEFKQLNYTQHKELQSRLSLALPAAMSLMEKGGTLEYAANYMVAIATGIMQVMLNDVTVH